MSYNITYNPEMRRKYPQTRKNRNKALNMAFILLVVFVAVYVLKQTGVVRYLIPGDPEITAEAFSTMVTRVGQGEAVNNAIVGFCREIISAGR